MKVGREKILFILFLGLMIMLPLFLSSYSRAGWPFGRSGISMGMLPGKDFKEICPMMGRMPAKGIARDALPEPESRGAELYSRYCSQCHALVSPKAHSAQEWEEAFRRMDARMQMMSRMRMMEMCRMMNIEAPNEEENKVILAYLQKHALKAIAKEELTAPESEGAILFKGTCTQCHDLPDPHNYAPEEWPLIVEKMEDIIIDQKGSTTLSQREKKLIIQYLQENSYLKASEKTRDPLWGNRDKNGLKYIFEGKIYRIE